MRKLKIMIKNMKLRNKTIIFVIGAFLAAVFISGFSFFMLYKYAKNEMISKTVQRIMIQKKSEIEEYFNDLEILAYNIGASSEIQKQLWTYKKSQLEIQDDMEEASHLLTSISGLNNNITIAVMLDEDRRMLNASSKYLDYKWNPQKQNWYSEFLKTGKYVEEGNGRGIYTRGKGWYLNIYYPINDKYSLEQKGILTYTFKGENFQKFMEMGAKDQYLRLENKNGEVIASNVSKDRWKILQEDKQNYARSSIAINIGDEKWNLKVSLDTKALQMDNYPIFIGFIVSIFVAGLLFIGAAILFSRYMTLPIIRCKEAMEEIRNNQIGIQVENPYGDEIGDLIQGFNAMSESIYDLIEKNKIISTIQKETEYQMLLEQINPHFLYNTLEIINGLILSGKEKEAVCVCENLGLIFRYNLKRTKWVSLEEELNYIRQYMTIAKYRISKLSTYIEVEPGLSECKILKSILQPIVENCIKHGFRDKLDECCISLLIRRKTNDLEIVIMDNGMGMKQDKCSEIKEKLENVFRPDSQIKETSVHIGLLNVCHRLYLEYEDRTEFEFISKDGLGTKVRIKIPIEL